MYVLWMHVSTLNITKTITAARPVYYLPHWSRPVHHKILAETRSGLVPPRTYKSASACKLKEGKVSNRRTAQRLRTSGYRGCVLLCRFLLMLFWVVAGVMSQLHCDFPYWLGQSKTATVNYPISVTITVHRNKVQLDWPWIADCIRETISGVNDMLSSDNY